jgi:hydrogenase nickel incorporation protein HypA/HybF
MHEYSLAVGIAETVSEFARKYPNQSVLKVRLRIGQLTCIETDQLMFCYESIVEGTALENSSLVMRTIPVAIKCHHCHYEGRPDYCGDALTASIPTMQCPRCGHAAPTTAGHECSIEKIGFSRRRTGDPAA